MSSYDEFLSEKHLIDDLLNEGYVLTSSKGSLDGDIVEFENKKTSAKKKLLLTTPDARKYYMTEHIKQQNQTAQ